ncbi:MAG: GntR family transcriptional regulator [Rhodothermales bacterium]
MITLDRDGPLNIRDQLIEQLRFQIASGKYPVGDVLPSTRAMGEQLQISFHTVRKAYQALEEEGLLNSKVGRGFRVTERAPLAKGDRIEQGAAVMHDALQHLIGIGLAEDEIEHLFNEQLDALTEGYTEQKLLFVAPYREMAEQCAQQIGSTIQRPVDAITVKELSSHVDADVLFTPSTLLRAVLGTAPQADVRGIVSYLSTTAITRIARMLAHETLGLVTRYADAVPYLMQQIKQETGFQGQIMAASLDNRSDNLTAFLQHVDLLVYTPKARRSLLPHLEVKTHVPLYILIPPDALAAIRQSVPV